MEFFISVFVVIPDDGGFGVAHVADNLDAFAQGVLHVGGPEMIDLISPIALKYLNNKLSTIAHLLPESRFFYESFVARAIDSVNAPGGKVSFFCPSSDPALSVGSEGHRQKVFAAFVPIEDF